MHIETARRFNNVKLLDRCIALATRKKNVTYGTPEILSSLQEVLEGELFEVSKNESMCEHELFNVLNCRDIAQKHFGHSGIVSELLEQRLEADGLRLFPEANDPEPMAEAA